MVLGDFSTALEMTVASPDSQTIRFQTSDFRRALRACGGRPLQLYMAASFDKTIQPRPWREGKHANQAAPDGNAPLSPLRGTSPGGGS